MEQPITYGSPPDELPDYTERMQSQLPALHLLIQLGWTYLPPASCAQLRDGRLGSAVLEPVLTQHIRDHARFDFKGQSRPFTENAIANAVQALKAFRATGATHQNEQVYDLLCLGTDVPQTVDGDTKSFKIHYIDWKNPANNTYHCAAEFKVERIGHQSHFIPDIVLFINGIPLVVVECKRSAYPDPRKHPVDLAIAQLADYQRKDGIPQLFLYSQLLLAVARDKAEYGTTATPRKFWSVWKEDALDAPVSALLAQPLPPGVDETLLAFPFSACAADFRAVLARGRTVCDQDRALYALCRPDRLLDLIFKYIVFDNGEKKIARYQQYFTVQDILSRVRSAPPDAPRPGGVVWHTQGSGKTINLLDAAERDRVLEDQGKSTEAKADMIASATRRVIEAEMPKDPAFYKKFSQMLEEILAALAAKRIQALEALGKIKDIATKVATHTGDDTPAELVGNDLARRFFGCVREDVARYASGNATPAAKVALAIVERIKRHKIRDWRGNQDALNSMRGEIDDIFFDAGTHDGLQLPLETQDKLIDACIEIARANED